jgi:hypothetical protein
VEGAGEWQPKLRSKHGNEESQSTREGAHSSSDEAPKMTLKIEGKGWRKKGSLSK